MTDDYRLGLKRGNRFGIKNLFFRPPHLNRTADVWQTDFSR